MPFCPIYHQFYDYTISPIAFVFLFPSSAKSRRVFSLHKLFSWVSTSRYTRLDQLQTDVLLVFSQAKEEGEELEHRGYGGVAKTARALEKAYVNIRDDVCGQGTVLWSPALKQRTLMYVKRSRVWPLQSGR